MKSINYNFSGMEECYSQLMSFSQDPKLYGKIGRVLKDLQRELNKFFKDSKCLEVLYTVNTDKIMFGMCVMPQINGTDIITDENCRPEAYYLELDSKLFDPILDLNEMEYVAITLHEIGHMVNMDSANEVRRNVDMYYSKNGGVFKPFKKHVGYREMITFGVADALRKAYSIFEKKDDEILADEFVATYGYGVELESALSKIVRHSHTVNRDVDNKFIVLCWTLRMYKNLRFNRIPVLRALNRAKHLSPSSLEKRKIEILEKYLRIMDKADFDDEPLSESTGNVFTKLKTSIYKKGIKGYYDDLFEFKMLARNIQHEDDALILLHKINSRMSIIDDYIEDEDTPDSEKKKWMECYDKYSKLREELSNKAVYRDDYRRINISYPDIVENRQG